MSALTEEGKRINNLLCVQKDISNIISTEIDNILHSRASSTDTVKDAIDNVLHERMGD